MGDDRCDELLDELADFLHGDMTAEKRASLQHHLEDCPPCFETADFQAQLRQLVAKRCCEEVPDELRTRIVSMLHVEVVEVTTTTEFTDPSAPS